MKKELPKITIPHRDNKPNFYCVKTEYRNDGKIECEIMADEETKLPIAIEVPDKPLEIVKAIRSFDPCMACATHMYNTKGEKLKVVTTDPYVGTRVSD